MATVMQLGPVLPEILSIPTSSKWPDRVEGIGGGAMAARLLRSTGVVRMVRAVPLAGVSHISTVASLGVNAPIPGRSIVTFSVRPGDQGEFEWRCLDHCGSGPNGEGGIMAWPTDRRGVIAVS